MKYNKETIQNGFALKPGKSLDTPIYIVSNVNDGRCTLTCGLSVHNNYHIDTILRELNEGRWKEVEAQYQIF